MSLSLLKTTFSLGVVYPDMSVSWEKRKGRICIDDAGFSLLPTFRLQLRERNKSSDRRQNYADGPALMESMKAQNLQVFLYTHTQVHEKSLKQLTNGLIMQGKLLR
jgi:hypothetical protein